MCSDKAVMTTTLPEVIEVIGHIAGPTVAVLGGVHGDELEGVLASRRIAQLLDPTKLRGTVRIAAPAYPAAWEAGSRKGPADGLNLARVFPGKPSGTETEQVAFFLTTEVIRGADLLIDLHSAGQGFDMPLLVGYHAGEGPLCARSGDFASAFGAPFLWEHPHEATGRSVSTATAYGVASIYVEGRGGGQVRRQDLDCYVEGVLRVLRFLSMIDTAPKADTSSIVVRGDGNTDGGIEAEVEGFFVTAVEVGQQISIGEPLGDIVSEDGETLTTVRSTRDGAVMLLRRPARVEPSDTLAIVATHVPQSEGVS